MATKSEEHFLETAIRQAEYLSAKHAKEARSLKQKLHLLKASNRETPNQPGSEQPGPGLASGNIRPLK